jgi:hypothetical protein
MNLFETINNLWYWTYGIIVGWGTSFTILLALIIVLFIKVVRLNHRINQVHSRLIAHEREVSMKENNRL